MANELYVLHLDGEILDRKEIWKKYSKNYGNNWLYGWKAPKPFYQTLGRAKCAIHHLPEQIKNKVEIIKYVPINE